MSRLTATRISRSKASKSRTRQASGKRQKRQADSPAIHPLLQMQQTHGNQAVGRLIQAQLKVSQPGDQYEQEADRVAEQVVDGQSSMTSKPVAIFSSSQGPSMQRMPEVEDDKNELKKPDEMAVPAISRMPEGKEDQELNRKPAEGESEEDMPPTLQAKPAALASPSVKPSVASNINRMQGGGKHLPKPVRAYFEPRMGADFSQVRVHTDPHAADTAKSINARAFTVGRNIAFGAGEYSPDTASGRKLLAHELTHVVQQQHLSNPVQQNVMRYRSSGAFRFNVKPSKASSGLIEQEFTDEQKQPWLKKITVNFTSFKGGSNLDSVPVGNLTGEYENNAGKLTDIKHTVTGGSSRIGYTDSGSFKVKRIEGAGYNQLSEKEGVGPRRHYDKDVGGGSMSYAVFFHNKQALHAGSLNEGSHSCVHVDWDNIDQIRQINYHSVVDKTEVVINYSSSVLNKICCDRRKHQNVKENEVLPNPCNNVSGKFCKGGSSGKKAAVCVPSDIVVAALQSGEMPDTNEALAFSNSDNNSNITDSNLVGLKYNDGLVWGTWDTRPRVQKLQEKLTEKGFYAKSDGMFGPKTLQALNFFQTLHGLKILDVVDEVTAARLEQGNVQRCPPGYTLIFLDPEDMS